MKAKVDRKDKDVEFHTLQFICQLTDILRPREEMTITQWAEKHMILPDTSNEPGRFRVDRAPYQKEIMDAITNPIVRDVSVMSSAQIGKTFIILCGIGYFIDYEPTSQMMVLPTLQLSERFSKTRLATMINDVEVLGKKIAPPKSKDSDNTILFKQYPGGHIVLAGANSAPSLSSMPLRVIWMDEIDRFPESAGSEGNPIKLAQKRSTTFWDRKHIKTSTPTIKGFSKIESEFMAGSMEEWCVQCPCCGTWQPYDFQRVIFSSVSMTCVSCKEDIGEMDWKECNHKWIAAHPERKTHRSFHINELASPFVRWEDIIKEFKEANEKLKKKHDAEDLKTFINTTLGQTWKETDFSGGQITYEDLQKRAEYYNADLPDGVLMLTAAIDVQGDRFEIEIRGWARDYESWGIYKTEIYGNIEQQGVWDKLEEYAFQTFCFENGARLSVAAVAIDTGYEANQVYKWVKKMKNKGKSVYGIKGDAHKPGMSLVHKRTDVDITEKINGKKVVVDHTEIFILGVDSGKTALTNRVLIENPGEGYLHFPSNEGRGYDKEYYKSLLSERKVIKKVRGVLKEVWVKDVLRNEPLDLYVYGYAACMIRRPAWDVLEQKIEDGINYMQVAGKGKKKRRRARKGIE